MSDDRFFIDRALLNRGHSSTWGNLGYWENDQIDYPQACEALAIQLGRRAELSDRDQLVDVGFGYGDQLVVWQQHFGVHHIRGFEVDAHAIAAARARVPSALFTADGAPGLRALPAASTDVVLALDCAYHFQTRASFFEDAARILKPRGRIALSDLVLPNERPSRFLLAAAQNARVPAENLVGMLAYRDALERSGFVDVVIDVVDERVLGGFARFAKRQWRTDPQKLRTGWAKVLATGLLATAALKRKWLHYVLVSARRA